MGALDMATLAHTLERVSSLVLISQSPGGTSHPRSPPGFVLPELHPGAHPGALLLITLCTNAAPLLLGARYIL